MMMYHAIFDVAGSTRLHWWANLDRQSLLADIVLPYVNKQVVPSKHGKENAIMNLGATSYLRIYKSQKVLEITQKFNEDEIVKSATECTLEIVGAARLHSASDESRSLLQNALATLKNQIFVVMKFGDKQMDSAYQGVIRPIAHEYGLTTLRIDEIQDSGSITEQILTEISRSRLVLCDLSGERPNCYYEAGFAHALGKTLIFTLRKDESIHFDLAGHRFIVWETELDLRTALRARFDALKKRGLTG